MAGLALAAGTLVFAHAGFSDAQAQDGAARDQAQEQANTAQDSGPGPLRLNTEGPTHAGVPEKAERMPALAIAGETVFVSQEVVQNIPEERPGHRDQAGEAGASSLYQLVADTTTDYPLTDELQCLAGTIYFEARSESLAGQLAVAQVVINRAQSSRFPSSYCGVVYQRAQFSFVRGGRMPAIKTGTIAWRRAKAIAYIAHHAQWPSEARDSLYFHAVHVRPRWSRSKAPRTQIDSHIFYR